VKEGATVGVGDLLGRITEGAVGAAPKVIEAKAAPAPAVSVSVPVAPSIHTADKLAPSVAKMVSEQGLLAAEISGSGRDGRILKGDVLAFSARGSAASGTPVAGSASVQQAVSLSHVVMPVAPASPDITSLPNEERVKMTRLRKTIATRLKEAQNTAAMLTTFNEVDMTHVMEARNQYQDQFVKKHGVKLGFMSFFVKAAITALKEIPAVNAQIDGEDLVYKNHYDIGVAVSTPTGLVVPVVRHADQLGFADVEKTIASLGQKARDGKLSMQELMGGTFTITNGGTFGSLMSTPILNPPQSGILGMHKIQDRPMVVNGKIDIRPMMYLALTYDHRIIDGREAVTFLVRVKECIENPERILFDI
jgi:2-oxoglutarate dehydrogenase E2 component (dihydrolipoamide succinyltransferase)